jgi:glycerol-3-phosphate dehydrogenase
MTVNPQASFSALARTVIRQQLATQSVDLLVIGGGITGAGIARDAALRGLKTALIERQDFAGGTSSRSARVVHGGVRYIESLQFDVVRQACTERNHLQRLAPHLVTPMPFTLPVYEKWSRYVKVQIGLWLYDLLGAAPHSQRRQTLTTHQLAAAEPALSQQQLVGAMRYHEQITDDARLTLATIRSAWQQGAVALNYAEVQGLLKRQGRIVGATIYDRLSGSTVEVQAKAVVNATGPWNDTLRRLDEADPTPTVRPNKGIHLVVPRAQLPIRHAVDFPAEGGHRTMYAVPWHHTCLVGTTDTDYSGDLDQIHAAADEVDWILASVNRAFPAVKLQRGDIISTFAGARPLVSSGAGKAYRASREHQITTSRSGLLSIVGGKLTTHRAMAKEVVDLVAGQLQHTAACTTDRTPLDARLVTANDVATWVEHAHAAAVNLDDESIQHLVTTYGAQSLSILELAHQQPVLQRRIAPALPYLYAEIPYAIHHEMTCTLSDLLVRRMHLIHEDRTQGLAHAEGIAQLMAQELQWNTDEIAAQVTAYRQEVALTRQFEAGQSRQTGKQRP